MYQVFCDGFLIHDLVQKDVILIDPIVTLRDNDSGQFAFKIHSNHPRFHKIKKLKSVVSVFKDSHEVFSGRVTEMYGDFYKNNRIICKGELDYLVDSIQRPAEYHNMTVREFLETLIAVHNGQVDVTKQFSVGQVTVVDSNDSLYRYTNYEDTLTCIKEKLIERLGGHIIIRKVNGERLIDYLADYPNTNEQVIQFGKNLLDFSTTIDATDIATAIIPLGGKLETATIPALDERLTIKSVNNGSDFIYSQDAVDNYGWIFRKVIFDDVNVPLNLKRKGVEYLNSVQYENLVLRVSAIDLNNLDVNIERIKLLDRIRCVSSPHALDSYFPVTELKLNLLKPESDKVTLGSEISDSSFTSSSVSTNKDIIERINAIPSKRVILQEATDNATALIQAATHGHVVTTAEEQLIMDTNDVSTATKVWRWNLGGLGFSNTGYNGTYLSAMTMDGQIVGQRIVAGSISGDKLDVVYQNSVENAIRVNGDGVLLSAKDYTDTQLQNYTTSADLQVTLNGITSTVSQKLDSSELSVRIQQSATDVKIAWNNISKFIQFENAELRIYDSANTSTQKLRSKLNDSGHHFYRDDYYVGKIGTNRWQANNSYKGLVFDLEPQGKYIAFAQKASPNDDAYTTMLCFSRENSAYTDYGLHLGCDLNAHYYTLRKIYLDDVNAVYRSSNRNGFTGEIPIITSITERLDGGFNWNTTKLRISNGIIVGYWYFEQPLFISAKIISVNVMQIMFNESINASTVVKNDFTVKVNGTPRIISNAALKSDNNKVVVLTIANPTLSASDLITVAYTQGSLKSIDAGENDGGYAPSFGAKNVINTL